MWVGGVNQRTNVYFYQGMYYYDVDMVNSLPNVARQLARLGMVSESSLLAGAAK